MQRNAGEIYNFQNQDFNTTRNWLLRRGYVFEDPKFKLDHNFEWRRPWQITRNPQLFVGGIARFDVVQGELGDCWMLAAISALANHPDLVRKVVPDDQSFTTRYAGIFHFRFWHFGKWFDVVIDDRLPTRNGQLAYTKSSSHNEFWTALLEKAYCKIIGGEYKVADAGNLCEALEDFTGGIVEQFLLQSVPRNFQNILLKAVERHSLVGCFIDDLPGSSEAPTPGGLVRGHSYSVTGARRVEIPGYGFVSLVRVRNPWGNFEWTGAWSDGSSEWRSVPQRTREQLGLVYRDDGEFWMSYDDFVTNFQWVDMCHLGPEVFGDAYGSNTSDSTWELNMIRGSWVRGVTAGGARDLHKNPQIKFTLNEADSDDVDGLCSVLVALAQRTNGNFEDYREIAYKIYQLDDPHYLDTTLDRYFIRNNSSVADVPVKTVREVAGRFNLPPGTYCVIPFTYKSSQEGEFLVRIYSEKRTYMDQMDYRIGMAPVDVSVSETPPMKIEAEALDLERPDKLEAYFDKVSGGDKEVDWKELKGLLDFAVKDAIATSEGKGESRHFLLDAFNFVYDKLFGSSVHSNPFKTIRPEGFSDDVCRSLVALVDIDHSGKLNFNEFQALWSEIKRWKSIYSQYSDNDDGYLNSSGLKNALEAAGYRCSRRILTDAIHRFTTKDGRIPFDDFLHCGLKLKMMSDFFRSKDKNDSHKAEFTLEEFMEKVLYS